MTNFLIWSGLYSFIANLFIGFFVYKKHPRRPVNIFFGLFSLSVSLWSVGSFLENVIPDRNTALNVLRLNYFFGVWLPPLYINFVYHLTRERSLASRVKLAIGYILSGVLSCFVFTPYFIKDLRLISGTTFLISDPGPVYYLFFSFFGIGMCEVLAHALIKLRSCTGMQKLQLKYMTIANGIAIFAGFEYFSRVFGFFNSPPLDDYILVAYLSVVAFAIVRHKLMDIEVIIRRTAVFAGLFAFAYAVFMLVTLLGRDFFTRSLGWSESASLALIVLIITLGIRPLERFLTNITEQFLFQKKYDYRELLKTFTDEILTVLDLQKLTEQTVAGLVKILKLEAACVLLRDKENKAYKVVAGYGMKEKDILIFEGDTLIRYLNAIHHPILKEKDVDRIHGDGHLKDDFKKLNAQLCLPISLHDDLVGVLALGMKKSGEDYTQEDIDILFALARTEAIAISNASLFDELSKTQAEAAQREKMAVIGTLAAGINHEICNPLGIVRGHCEMFLLNLRDGFYGGMNKEEIQKLSAEIMTKVIRETDRATAITKKLSSFAKPSRKVDTEEVHIEKEVEEVLGLVAHDLKFSNIDVQIQFPNDFPSFRADRKQIQEVLFNIIRNAAQAIDKKEGRIVLSGLAENGSVFLKISDNGAGIPTEKLSQIFSPFFTTKAPGQGTGLGLFIVKQIVERNKGTIQVESEPGIGTTFTLRFSLSQAELVHN